MKMTKKSLSELASEMKKFPQKLVNIRVTDKHHVTDNEKVGDVIAEVETGNEWRWPYFSTTFRNRATCSCDG